LYSSPHRQKKAPACAGVENEKRNKKMSKMKILLNMMKHNKKALIFVVPAALLITLFYKAQSDNYKNDLKGRVKKKLGLAR
jgi:invasion protein IalB